MLSRLVTNLNMIFIRKNLKFGLNEKLPSTKYQQNEIPPPPPHSPTQTS